MIREASADDMPEIMALLAHLMMSSGALGKFDEDAVRAAAIKMMEGENSVMFRSRRGLIAGFTMPAWDAPDWLMAVEMWWWAEDGKWMALLRRFEEWVRKQGAGEIRITSKLGPQSGRIMKVFRRAGYEPREICYRKVI